MCLDVYVCTCIYVCIRIPHKPRPASPKLQCYAKQSFDLSWPYRWNFLKKVSKSDEVKMILNFVKCRQEEVQLMVWRYNLFPVK